MASGLLSAIEIRNAKPGDKPRKLRDGNGLHLLVHPNGSKYFQLRYTLHGKEKTLQLGVYPTWGWLMPEQPRKLPYVRAGYRARGNSAEVSACRLLRNAKVQEAIERKQREAAKRCELTSETIIREATAVAFSDIRKLFNTDGSPKAIHEIDDATASAISSIEVGQTISDRKVTGRTFRIKFWDKNSAQERLFRQMGLFRKEDASQQSPRKIGVAFVSPDGEVVPVLWSQKRQRNRTGFFTRWDN
jgi:phage terminase small subunit